MIVNLIAAGLSGAFILLALKAVGLDPAQSSAILLTTVTDVIGFFSRICYDLPEFIDLILLASPAVRSTTVWEGISLD